jgi:uncharacterized protein YcbX
MTLLWFSNGPANRVEQPNTIYLSAAMSTPIQSVPKQLLGNLHAYAHQAVKMAQAGVERAEA